MRELRRADPALAHAMAQVGPCTLEARAEGTHFDALFRSILYQQLSGRAAGTIHRRVIERFGGHPPTPADVLEADDASLRACGVSRQKISYLRDLAVHVDRGALPLDRVEWMPDTAVEASLVAVKGVGRWTAQMFLMFRLGRPDVLPDGDLGIQKGIQMIDGGASLPLPRAVALRGAVWAPWRTVASWYLWRTVDGDGAAAP